MDADQPKPSPTDPPSPATAARISRAIATQPDPVQALWQLLCALREDLNIDRAGVFIYQRRRNSLDRVAGVDQQGRPEFFGESIEITETANPLMEVALRSRPYYLSNSVRTDYAQSPVPPGVTALAVIPIIVGDELLGILAADNCLRGRPMPEGLLEPLFLYASLSALPLFALYQQQEHERTEALRREFLREMLSAVTDGKIHLCTQDEIEEQWPSLENPIRVETQGDVPTVRDAARQTALRAGMTHERTANFELCAAEAASNALLHGSGGVAAFGRDEKCVRVRMTDWGAGIPAADLPPALLLAGKTSKVSAGLGYTLIVEDADHLYIHTSPKGTTVIVEMAIEEEIKIPDAWNHLF